VPLTNRKRQASASSLQSFLAAVAASEHPGIERGAVLECPESCWKFCLMAVYSTHPRGRRNTPLPNLGIDMFPHRAETERIRTGLFVHSGNAKTQQF